MKAKFVIPHKWIKDSKYPPRVLYDEDRDNYYSAIWGMYDGEKRLGVRYSITPDNPNGYPQYAGNPIWYVEPPFLTPILLDELLRLAKLSGDKEQIENCEFAIEEFKTL